MAVRSKVDFPADGVRRFLEPGPIVLVSSAYKGKTNIMTMGWHMMLGYDVIGCFIWDQNHSRDMIRKSRECVINIPTTDMAAKVVGIGNMTGARIDKFTKFKLTPAEADIVSAPLIAECHANIECKLVDDSLIRKYSLFVFEVVKAHAFKTPRTPKTMHYTGDGIFMTAGRIANLRSRFKPGKM